LVNEDAAPEIAVALDMMAALAAPEADVLETPEAFLTGVAAALKASDDVDAELAAILSDHLLTITPHDNVIANAKAAILTLAAERAAPTEEQADG
jgi:predicted amidohydrolase